MLKKKDKRDSKFLDMPPEKIAAIAKALQEKKKKEVSVLVEAPVPVEIEATILNDTRGAAVVNKEFGWETESQ